MAAPVAVIAGKIAVQVVASERGRKILSTLLILFIGLLLLPILLITGLFTCLSGWLHLDPPESPYRIAEQILIEQYDIGNSLDVQAVKTIDLLANPDMDEDAMRIMAMVEEHFLKTITIGEGEDIEVLTLFLNRQEMELLLPLPPFSFDEEKMEAFRLLAALDFLLSAGGQDGESGSGEQNGIFSGSYPMPLDSGRITSGFGNRDGQFSGFHGALDIRPPQHHAPIYAIADGEVVSSTVHSSYGNYVKIRHTAEDGTLFYTLSAHLSQRLVQVGDSVTSGQTIGLEGGEPGVDPNPGNTSGHHLHFEVRLADGRTKVDPATFLRGWE